MRLFIRLYNTALLVKSSRLFGPMNLLRLWSLSGDQAWEMPIVLERTDPFGTVFYSAVMTQYLWAENDDASVCRVFTAACCEGIERDLDDTALVVTPYGMIPWAGVRAVFCGNSYMAC